MNNHGSLRNTLHALDYPLLIAVLLMYLTGVATIYSAGGGPAGLGKFYAGRQLIWGLAAIVMLAVVLRLDYEFFLDASYWLYGGCCLLLLLLFAMGHRAKGAQSWINLGFFKIQPAEFVKLGLAFVMAHHLTLFPPYNLKNFAGALALGGVSALLVLVQPDLGSTLVYGVMIFVALLVAGAPKRYLLSLMGGAAALLPLAISEWNPARDYARNRIESQKADAMYSALTADPALKAKLNSLNVEVRFFHEADGDYTLQSGDDCILYAALQGPYADAETFAADCMAVMQRAADDGLGFTCYHFDADEDTDDGISYYLDCVASYPAGLTAAQVAQRVQTSYHYDNNSFSSEADRDDYIRRQLQNEISDEYADRHDGAYPDEKYLNEETERRFAERTGMATPESAQA